ncbi:MAG: HisA/HisF-related TIM barrel protein [Candidatus Aenigmatarchaeota archaeon]
MVLAKRIVVCLDVRKNEQGIPVVTKGLNYDVRDENAKIRNLGYPAEMARNYSEQGADEICFLDITATAHDRKLMLPVLEETAESVFVPLSVGGGIRGDNLDYVHDLFRAGADKVSLGSIAVTDVLDYINKGYRKNGKSMIERISESYGSQACVISVDPKRRYVSCPKDINHPVIETKEFGPNGERYFWSQCSIKGGREFVDLDTITLVRISEELGAGEILLNSMDRDGTGKGYDVELIGAVSKAVRVPVIASSGAGCEEHVYQVFSQTDCSAALIAGLFHRGELTIPGLKQYLYDKGLPIRLD